MKTYNVIEKNYGQTSALKLSFLAHPWATEQKSRLVETLQNLF